MTARKLVLLWRGSMRHMLRRNQFPITLILLLAASIGAVGASPAGAATLVVTNSNDKGPGSLRATITNAKNGDTIVFAPSLNGQTITLTSDQLTINKNLDIEGPGQGLLAVSGSDHNRIFNINEGLSVTIAGLTMTHGRATGSIGHDEEGVGGGGAILNVGSVLNLANDAFNENVSRGDSTGAVGGAIAIFYSGGNGFLTVSDSVFSNNSADCRVGKGQFAEGGAIFSPHNGPGAEIDRCTFTGNKAIGADGLQGLFLGLATGGALHLSRATTFTVRDSFFVSNQAIGGSFTSESVASSFALVGAADGGAISSHDRGKLIVSGCGFAYNKAVAGSNSTALQNFFGGAGFAQGGAINSDGATTISNSTFLGNEVRGGDACSERNGAIGFSGSGIGGAVACGAVNLPLSISGSTFTNNHAQGGAGSVGGLLPGAGAGGAVSVVNGCNATISSCSFGGNQAIGGAGGNGLGGGIFSGGSSIANFQVGVISTLCMTGSSVTGNTATGGITGQGIGGGSYLASGGFVCFDPFTSANTSGNLASTNFNDIFGTFTICP